jgi:hypothetical protein
MMTPRLPALTAAALLAFCAFACAPGASDQQRADPEPYDEEPLKIIPNAKASIL